MDTRARWLRSLHAGARVFVESTDPAVPSVEQAVEAVDPVAHTFKAGGLTFNRQGKLQQGKHVLSIVPAPCVLCAPPASAEAPAPAAPAVPSASAAPAPAPAPPPRPAPRRRRGGRR